MQHEVSQSDLAAREVNTLSDADLAGLASLIKGGTSENTRRTYRAAVARFIKSGAKLPCSPESICKYIVREAGTLNPRTIQLHITAVSKWHELQGQPDPTQHPDVRKALKGLNRTKGVPKQKASAVEWEDVKKCLEFCQTLPALLRARNKALLLIGFMGAFRRSEISDIKHEDLRWTDKGLLITLPKSKTDQEGAGIIRAIPMNQDPNGPCAVRALKRWLETAGIEGDYVFRSINKWGELGGGRLDPGSINRIFQQIFAGAGLSSSARLSAHSLRRGMATSAYKKGAGLLEIKRQGGWKSDATVQGYIAEEESLANNVLNKFF